MGCWKVRLNFHCGSTWQGIRDKKISLQGVKKTELIDITDKIVDAVQKSNVAEGLCVIFTPHTTAALTINENSDPDVQTDMMFGLTSMIPDDDYRHFELNSPSHILSSIIGVSETLLIENSKLILGAWQAVYYCEFDGPREREFYVKII